jgi:hypothetical protein
MFGAKQVEVISKPIEIEIMQPTMPRSIDLKEPHWFVVSEAKVSNPCVKDEEGKRPRNEDKTCTLGKEHPDWPEDYSYLDKFLDEIKKQNGGDVVFIAMTMGDYELMSFNMQELRRYIREVQEVVVYYRNVTIKNPDGTTEAGVGVTNGEDSRRPSIGLFPRDNKE